MNAAQAEAVITALNAAQKLIAAVIESDEPSLGELAACKNLQAACHDLITVSYPEPHLVTP